MTCFPSMKTPHDSYQILARCSNHKWLAPQIDTVNKSLTYNLKRVGRLRQLRAAALLIRYANFLSRYAFDHDLGERQAKATAETAAVPFAKEPEPKEQAPTNTSAPAAGAPPQAPPQ